MKETTAETDVISMDTINNSVDSAVNALIAEQNPDGHWRYDVEPFIYCTALHVLTLFYINEPLDRPILQKLGNYLRRNQLSTGGWGFVPGDTISLTNSVNSYFALRLIGDGSDEEHMIRARNAIQKNGGIEATNFFTRFYLVLFGIIPWSGIPVYPVEIMLLPDWFPFTIYKLSYWIRTSFVPIMILQYFKKPAHDPQKISLNELFIGQPSNIPQSPRIGNTRPILINLFAWMDKILKFAIQYIIPISVRKMGLKRAMKYMNERLNGENGYGSLIPAMHYALMTFYAMDYPMDHLDRVSAARASGGKVG